MRLRYTAGCTPPRTHKRCHTRCCCRCRSASRCFRGRAYSRRHRSKGRRSWASPHSSDQCRGRPRRRGTGKAPASSSADNSNLVPPTGPGRLPRTHPAGPGPTRCAFASPTSDFVSTGNFRTCAGLLEQPMSIHAFRTRRLRQRRNNPIPNTTIAPIPTHFQGEEGRTARIGESTPGTLSFDGFPFRRAPPETFILR